MTPTIKRSIQAALVAIAFLATALPGRSAGDTITVVLSSPTKDTFYANVSSVPLRLGYFAAEGLTVNIPLPAGTTGDVMLAAFDDVVAPVVERFAPTWVLVSAGFDAHRADPLAGMELSAGDFADMARRVRGFTDTTGRLALLLEGGYDLDALRESAGAALAAVLDVDFRPERSSHGGPGAEAVHAARRVHVDGAGPVPG